MRQPGCLLKKGSQAFFIASSQSLPCLSNQDQKRLEDKTILISPISLRPVKLNINHQKGKAVKKSEVQAFTAAVKQDILG